MTSSTPSAFFWTRNHEDRRSINAYCICLSRQYRAPPLRPSIGKCLLQLLTLSSSNLFLLPDPPTLQCDNSSVTYIAVNLDLRHRIKHMNLNNYFVRVHYRTPSSPLIK
ncbi:hypothetical protein V2J09_020835 [Rumex salicifolius]